MSNSIVIINHGFSNLNSISRALEECGANVKVTEDAHDLISADKIVLPGVGAFSSAMKTMHSKGLSDALLEQVQQREVPVLGICLGMQLLASNSIEGGVNQGLNLIPGSVIPLKSVDNERIPHMGWNEVNPTKPSMLFEDIKPQRDFYFVHSFHLDCDEEYVIAKTPYCGQFTSAVAKDSVMAVQFHPEKSLKAGFAVLKSFLEF